MPRAALPDGKVAGQVLRFGRVANHAQAKTVDFAIMHAVDTLECRGVALACQANRFGF